MYCVGYRDFYFHCLICQVLGESLPVIFFGSDPKKLAQIYPICPFVDKRSEDKLGWDEVLLFNEEIICLSGFFYQKVCRRRKALLSGWEVENYFILKSIIKINNIKLSERNKGSIQKVKNRWRFRADLRKKLVIRHRVMLWRIWRRLYMNVIRRGWKVWRTAS